MNFLQCRWAGLHCAALITQWEEAGLLISEWEGDLETIGASPFILQLKAAAWRGALSGRRQSSACYESAIC